MNIQNESINGDDEAVLLTEELKDSPKTKKAKLKDSLENECEKQPQRYVVKVGNPKFPTH